MVHTFRRLRASAFLLCCLPTWLSAHAADKYPDKPVRVVVPFPAGGGSDTLARTMGLALQQALERPFLVDNKSGATGNIGTEFVARSPGDGYTLLVVPNSLVINKSLYPKLSFDPQRSFKPIALLGSSPVVVGVKASLPVNSIQELIAMARKNPGKLSYASCGSGSPQHIAGELFKMMAKVDITHIPYKGCAPAVVDAAGGLVDVVFNTVANIRPFVQTGKVRALAVTSAKRSALAPELPTVQESRLPGYDVDVWFGALAPAGTPDAVIARLNAEINKSLARPEVRESMAKISYEPTGGSSKQFADVLQRDLDRYGAIISKAGIKLD